MITSISEDVGRVSRRGQIKDYQIAYRRLDEFVEKVDSKILSRLQLYQQVYFEDYKEQVQTMSQQLKILRSNLDCQVLNSKSSQKMFNLEEERDFFRTQVLKLNGEVNSLLQQNKELKNKVFNLEDEINNYKVIAFNFEKKFQKLQLEKTQMVNFKRQTSNSIMQKVNRKDKQEQQKQGMAHRTLQPRTQICISRANSMERKLPSCAVKQRTYSKGQSATKASMRRYEVTNQRDNIIDQCIKETKKQIFFRNTEPKHQVIPFEEVAKITFDKFTRTDKKNVITKLLNNQKLMDQFAQFLANRNTIQTTSRMVRTKIGDQKFNEKFLVDLKRSFTKKMYDVKASKNVQLKAKQDLDEMQ